MPIFIIKHRNVELVTSRQLVACNVPFCSSHTGPGCPDVISSRSQPITSLFVRTPIPKTLLQFWLTGCQGDARAGLKKQKTHWSLQNVPLCCHPTIPTSWWAAQEFGRQCIWCKTRDNHALEFHMEDTPIVLDFTDFDDVWRGPFWHENQNMISISMPI